MFEQEVIMAQVKDFFVSYQWQELLFDIKIVFIIISFILVALIILLLLKISLISPLCKALRGTTHKQPDSVFSKKKILKLWARIDSKLKSGIEGNHKVALIEADKLFDMVLKNIGYGQKKKLVSLEEIKAAGKIKDKIIEEKRFKPSKEETEKSIQAYKRGLEELGVL
jgi:hypothetical protein